MKLQLTKDEIKNVIISVFANGGLSYLNFDLDYSNKEYLKHNVEGESWEDNLFHLLENGGKITFIDNEDDDSEYTTDLTMKLIEERLENCTEQDFIDCVVATVNGEDDAETGYCLIQWFLFNEVIFG